MTGRFWGPAIFMILALGEGCVLLAERGNDHDAMGWLVLSLIGAPCFGLLFFALPAMVIGSLIASARYPRRTRP